MIHSAQVHHEQQLAAKDSEIRQVSTLSYMIFLSPHAQTKRDNTIKVVETRKLELESKLARALNGQVSVVTNNVLALSK